MAHLPTESKISNIEITLENGETYSLDLQKLLISEDKAIANETIMQLQYFNWENECEK
jgi:hypothetical protein